MGLATRITNEYRMPELRNNTITMPGRHGVLDFGETVSERKILISCFIPPGETDEQFLSKKDDIIEWLNPDNGLCQLILDKEPGRVYEARLRRSVTECLWDDKRKRITDRQQCHYTGRTGWSNKPGV